MLSKSYGLAGLRIGWVASRDRELLEKMTRFKHYLSICNSGPSEALAEVALKHGDKLLSRNREIIAEWDMVESLLSTIWGYLKTI